MQGKASKRASSNGSAKENACKHGAHTGKQSMQKERKGKRRRKEAGEREREKTRKREREEERERERERERKRKRKRGGRPSGLGSQDFYVAGTEKPWHRCARQLKQASAGARSKKESLPKPALGQSFRLDALGVASKCPTEASFARPGRRKGEGGRYVYIYFIVI